MNRTTLIVLAVVVAALAGWWFYTESEAKKPPTRSGGTNPAPRSSGASGGVGSLLSVPQGVTSVLGGLF